MTFTARLAQQQGQGEFPGRLPKLSPRTKWCIGVVVLRGRPLTHVRNLSMKPEPFYRAFSFFFLHENSQRG